MDVLAFLPEGGVTFSARASTFFAAFSSPSSEWAHASQRIVLRPLAGPDKGDPQAEHTLEIPIASPSGSKTATSRISPPVGSTLYSICRASSYQPTSRIERLIARLALRVVNVSSGSLEVMSLVDQFSIAIIL